MKKRFWDVNTQEKPKENDPPMTAGQSFVKMIGPFGSILFLLVFILFLIICFTSGGSGA